MGGAKRYPSILSRATVMDFAEFIIGPAEGRTRWLYPSYGRRYGASLKTTPPVPKGTPLMLPIV